MLVNEISPARCESNARHSMRVDIFKASCFESIFMSDAAVAIDKKREPQPFRGEVDGFLPLSRHRSAVLQGDVEPHSNDVRTRKITLKLNSRTPSLLQDSTSLPATAESGFKSACAG